MAAAREALVVFEDRADAALLRWLRPGFRHCFCLTGDGCRWTLCDPLKSRVAVTMIDGITAAQLAAHLLASGRRVLHGPVIDTGAGGHGGLRLLTCVEVVKRLVGLEAATVLTPFQLYRRLLRPDGWTPAFVECEPARLPKNNLTVL